MRGFLVLLATLSCVLARPGDISGGGGSFGGDLQLDSYAAPLPSTGGGSYPSGGPAPQYGVPQQAPVVHKHVYVHVPPPETSYPAARRPVQPPPPPQKHYKIVFIKAPTPPPPTVPDIPALPPPAEQKTLIYVLVKKPDEAPEINIPTPAPTPPSKPEVYFIRYKTQKQEGYAPSGVPQSEYGAPSGDSFPSAGPSAPSSSYGAPSGGSGPY
ncbi:tweedleE isoform X2 [Rhodnius prolixus]|uniref:tweedleE isoform X2 n=1 Tax=Rhodnius prolixus TaxID=13249 RepID=UPI003D187B92